MFLEKMCIEFDAKVGIFFFLLNIKNRLCLIFRETHIVMTLQKMWMEKDVIVSNIVRHLFGKYFILQYSDFDFLYNVYLIKWIISSTEFQLFIDIRFRFKKTYIWQLFLMCRWIKEYKLENHCHPNVNMYIFIGISVLMHSLNTPSKKQKCVRTLKNYVSFSFFFFCILMSYFDSC